MATRTGAFAWLCSSLLALMGCGDITTSADTASLQQGIRGGVGYGRCAWPAVVSLGGCSGTLVHSRLVVYAAHCGTAMNEVRFGVDAAHPEKVVPTAFCGAYPNATLGDGTDLAYCVLAEDVRDREPARILAGCEVAQLAVGREVQLVGFGVAEQGGNYGLARSASATLSAVADELVISGNGVDTCKGDSGGPVFLPVADDSGGTQRRVVGVTSAGSSAICGEGVAHYVNLARKVDWLEQASGVDVTPCFAGGAWAPTPECTATRSAPTGAADAGPDCEEQGEPRWLATCGAAAQPEANAQPPSLSITVPPAPLVEATLSPSQAFFETPVAARAEAAGAGVKRVTFTLLSAAGSALMQRVDEVPPFGLPSLRLPVGSYVLQARADDFSDQSASATVEFRIANDTGAAAPPERGCAVARNALGRGSSGVMLSALSALVLFGRRARRNQLGALALQPRTSKRARLPR